MSELERAAAFEETLRNACAERVVETQVGPALFNDTYARVWNLNVLRVERPGDATATDIAAEAERVQGGAGLPHRRVLLAADDERLVPGFLELGWKPDHFVFMVRRRRPEERVDASAAEEIDAARLRALRAAILREWLPGADDDLAGELFGADSLWWRRGNGRTFAVLENGAPVSAAVLYSDGSTAQVEDVATLPEFRGRGLAKAVVQRAVDEALATGHDFVFLVADADDWPKDLYRRLGFEDVGGRWAFTLPAVPDGTRPADPAP